MKHGVQMALCISKYESHNFFSQNNWIFHESLINNNLGKNVWSWKKRFFFVDKYESSRIDGVQMGWERTNPNLTVWKSLLIVRIIHIFSFTLYSSVSGDLFMESLIKLFSNFI